MADSRPDTRQQAQMLMQIQQRQFALVELNLFLDTHPTEAPALAIYNRLHQELMTLIYQYEHAHGPLLNFGFSSNPQNTWKWAEGPWPWELQY